MGKWREPLHIEDAVDACIEASGKSRKEVAVNFFGSSKTVEQAHQALTNLLNPELRPRLGADQAIKIVKTAGEYEPFMLYICAQLGYHMPTRIDPNKKHPAQIQIEALQKELHANLKGLCFRLQTEVQQINQQFQKSEELTDHASCSIKKSLPEE